MKQRDILALIDGITPGIDASFQKAVASLVARLDAAEKRVAELEKAPADIDLDAIIADAIARATAPLEKRLDVLGEERSSLVTRLGFVEGFTDASVAKNEFRPVVDRLAAAEKRLDDLPRPAEPVDLTPLTTLVAVLEERVLSLPNVPTAADVAALVAPGNDADPEVTRTLVVDEVGKAVAAIPPVDLAPLQAAINAANAATAEATALAEAYKQAIADLPKVPTAEEVRALIPTPENGKSVTIDEVRPLVEEAVAAIPRIVQDGKDATPEQIAEAVDKALATWERPKDGESVTLEQLRPLVDETVAKRVAEIPASKDGVGLAGMLIDRDGELVATLTDGTTKKLGPVVGKDGEPGVGWDEATEEMADDGRTIVRRYAKGDQVTEFRHTFAVVLDRGVFKDGSEYVAGDGVTYGGSFWIAQATTKDKPGNSDAWRLAVKKGRDGKDGRDLGPPPPLPKVKL